MPDQPWTSDRIEQNIVNAWQQATLQFLRDGDGAHLPSGVVGVGITVIPNSNDGTDWGIKLYLSRRPLPGEYPPDIQGVPVVTEYTGKFIGMLGTTASPGLGITRRPDPRVRSTFGTLGCLLEDTSVVASPRPTYLLSVNHVIGQNRLSGVIKDRASGDILGNLAAEVMLTDVKGSSNLDCAIARLDSAIKIDTAIPGLSGHLTDSVLEDPTVGDSVGKSGTSTFHTTGRIDSVLLNCSVTITIPGRSGDHLMDCYFESAVSIVAAAGTQFCQAGDSGSLVYTMPPNGVRRALGLLVGAPVSGASAVVCPFHKAVANTSPVAHTPQILPELEKELKRQFGGDPKLTILT